MMCDLVAAAYRFLGGGSPILCSAGTAEKAYRPPSAGGTVVSTAAGGTMVVSDGEGGRRVKAVATPNTANTSPISISCQGERWPAT